MTDSRELREALVARLCETGAITRDDVADAFASVPREAFLAGGFRPGGTGPPLRPGDDAFVEAAYSDDALVTKVADGMPTSSSSQPSLMALMIEAVDVRRGMRVLEIGAGTGYNAAVMAALGALVTSVDAQSDVAAAAALALRSAGVTGARVVPGDGYLGAPDGAPYDRVIVTVGVSGLSPHWMDQLAPGGQVVAPTRHAGANPVLRAWHTDEGGVLAVAVCGAGFMPASGPLGADYPGAHPPRYEVRVAVPDDEPDAHRGRTEVPVQPAMRLPARWSPPMSQVRYADLWFAIGVWDRRATMGAFEEGECVLDDPSGAAAIARDGSVAGFGPAAFTVAADAAALIDRWTAAGAPLLSRWHARLTLSGDPTAPIWVPATWALASSGPSDGRDA
jgi:protein-L-isoaspartate(D-aspartate) O-methyltransferase